MSFEKYSHALVYLLADDKFLITTITKIIDLDTPMHKTDFIQNKVYNLKINRKQEKIHIVDLGNIDEMNESLQHTENCDISHALVDVIELQELSIVSVKNIEELKSTHLGHMLQFDKYTIYHAHLDERNVYHDVFIHKLGDYDKLLLALDEINSDISTALVRFLDKNLLDVIDVDNIKEYELTKPDTRFEYEPLKCYKGKLNDEALYEDIQILKLGSYDETTRCIDFYNGITHALVLFKPRNTTEIILIECIKEFKNEPPETCNDFNKNKPYSARLPKASHYCAIQIIELGCLQILKFKNVNSKRRYHVQNFQASQLEECNKTVTDFSGSESSLKIGDFGHETNSHSETEEENDSIKGSRKNKGNQGNKNPSTSSENVALLQKRKDILLRSRDTNQGHEDINILPDIANTFSRGVPGIGRGASTPKNRSDDEKQYQSSRNTGDRHSKASFPVNDESSDDETQRGQSTSKRLKRARISRKRSKAGRFNVKNSAGNDRYYETTWSDSSTGSADGYGFLDTFDAEDENTGQVVKFLHIGYKQKIPAAAWKNLENECFDDSAFIEQLSRSLYGKKIFELYLQKKEYMRVVEGKIRRLVSNDELKAMKLCLRYWVYSKAQHLLQTRSIERIVSLANIKSILSQEINYQFRKYQEKHPTKVTYEPSSSFKS